MRKPKTTKRVGRPPEIDQAKVQAIVEALQIGAPVTVATAFAGIAVSTYYAWLRTGARSKKRGCPYRAFSEATKRAIAAAHLGHLGTIAQAAKGRPALAAVPEIRTPEGVLVQEGRPAQPAIPPAWQASAWWLERRNPELYARRVYRVEDEPAKQEAADRLRTSMQAVIEGLGEEERAKYIAEARDLERRAGALPPGHRDGVRSIGLEEVDRGEGEEEGG